MPNKDCDCDKSKCVHLNRCMHVEKLAVDHETNTNSLNVCKEAKVGCLNCCGEAKIGSLEVCNDASVKCLDVCEKAKVGCLDCRGKAKVGDLEVCGCAKVGSLDACDINTKSLSVCECARVGCLEVCGEASVGSLVASGEVKTRCLEVAELTKTQELVVVNNANINGNLTVSGVATFGDVFYPNPWGQMRNNGTIATNFGDTNFVQVPVPAVIGDVDAQSFVASTVTNAGQLTYTGLVPRKMNVAADVTLTLANGTGSTVFEVALSLNGSTTPIPGTVQGLTLIDGSLPVDSTAMSTIVTMDTNDYLGVLVRRVSGGTINVTTNYNVTATALPNVVV